MAKAEYTVKLREGDMATLFFDDEVAVLVGGTYVPLNVDDLLNVGPADGDEELGLIEALIGHLYARMGKIEAKEKEEADAS